MFYKLLLHQFSNSWYLRCPVIVKHYVGNPSSSKTEELHLSRNSIQCSLQVGGVSLKQVEKFNILGLHSRVMERKTKELDVRLGKPSAVMRALHHLLSKQELSRKAKLLVFKSIFVPIFIYGHKSWVMTKKAQSQMPVSKMRFLQKIKGVTLFDEHCNTAILQSLYIELLLLRIERSLIRWFGHVSRTSRKNFIC